MSEESKSPKKSQALLILAMVLGAVVTLTCLVLLALETTLAMTPETRTVIVGTLATGVASLFGGAYKFQRG